jgi:2-hydroxy-3-keto-5-methylthiopentenyl-1-phosphate phosphatase
VTLAEVSPRFPPDGAPVSVLVDFDGTVSLADVGDALLSGLVPDQAEVARMDRLYDDGRVGSRELTRWDMDVLPADADLLLREALAIPLDETFGRLVAAVRSAGAVLEVVSDGVGFHIGPMLERAGLGDVPVATNTAQPGQGGAAVSFPFGHPACFVCGTCKRERVRAHQAAQRAVVFVGDGTSDRYAAHHADIVFAKASLARYCADHGLDHEPWERLADVAAWLAAALADGRLPADRAAFPEWAPRWRPGPETFICGPEVWGEGRHSPVPLVNVEPAR